MSFLSEQDNSKHCLVVDGSLASGYLPHADLAIGVPSEQGVTVGRPCERDARDWQSLALGVGDRGVKLELIDDALALEVLKYDV